MIGVLRFFGVCYHMKNTKEARGHPGANISRFSRTAPERSPP